MTYYSDPLVTLLLGDCLEVMATLPADSVDAVVTDPPYALAFMNKHWDEHLTPHKFMAWCTQWGREALRVTEPGGYLLAFGGTRTHHRLVCALEDAGWIIRDELTWVYASGFPKGKANLKPAHEPIVLARKPGPLRPLAIDECRIATDWSERSESWKRSGHSAKPDAEKIAAPPGIGIDTSKGRWPSNVLLTDPELFDEPNPYVVGSGATSESAAGLQTYRREPTHNTSSYQPGAVGHEWQAEGYGDSGGYSRFFIVPKADRAERERGLAPGDGVWSDGREKAADYPSQRGATARANVHPTVKPIDLMRHLVRLVTPSGGTVLDPFLGSGTTCLAASELGVCSIGIEREADYLDIAKDRLIATPMGLGLDVLSVDAS